MDIIKLVDDIRTHALLAATVSLDEPHNNSHWMRLAALDEVVSGLMTLAKVEHLTEA